MSVWNCSPIHGGDKTMTITGHGAVMWVDYDDVEAFEVLITVREVLRILNEHWDYDQVEAEIIATREWAFEKKYPEYEEHARMIRNGIEASIITDPAEGRKERERKRLMQGIELMQKQLEKLEE